MSYDNNRIIAEATAIGEHFDRNYFTRAWALELQASHQLKSSLSELRLWHYNVLIHRATLLLLSKYSFIGISNFKYVPLSFKRYRHNWKRGTRFRLRYTPLTVTFIIF